MSHIFLLLVDTRQIFLIQEYVAGGDLLDYVTKRGHLEEAQARRFFAQMQSAVEYMHSNQIVHRDLKPENCLVDQAADSVKIIDFGLSNFYQLDSSLSTYCGTPNYAPPEIWSERERETPP